MPRPRPFVALHGQVDFNGLRQVDTINAADIFVCRQGALGDNVFCTQQQLVTMPVGGQFLADDGSALLPSYAFVNNTDMGFFRSGANLMQLSFSGSARWQFGFGSIAAVGGTGITFTSTAPTATIPNIIPVGANPQTGVGHAGTDELSLIAGNVQVANLTEVAGVVQFIVPSQNNIATPAIAIGDGDTGILETADDVAVLASLAQNCLEWSGIGAVPLIAFYGTAAIALQTGVAVTAAGIHAALVNLGLITA